MLHSFCEGKVMLRRLPEQWSLNQRGLPGQVGGKKETPGSSRRLPLPARWRRACQSSTVTAACLVQFHCYEGKKGRAGVHGPGAGWALVLNPFTSALSVQNRSQAVMCAIWTKSNFSVFQHVGFALIHTRAAEEIHLSTVHRWLWRKWLQSTQFWV